MRSIRFSLTALQSLELLLGLGSAYYSDEFLTYQKNRVFDSVRVHLLAFPEACPVNKTFRNLRIYNVKHTPFAVVYDFDDTELRIRQIVHRRANRTPASVANIQW
jgi:hypothetical protein